LNAFAACCLGVAAVVVAEMFLPGHDTYHTGWFNVALLALGIAAVVLARREFARARSAGARGAIVAAAFGAAVLALAGTASGLLAPDNRTIVGAPGQRVRVDDLGGSLIYPPADASPIGANAAQTIVLERGARDVPLGERGRIAGSFILRPSLRQVVFVEARDDRGARLTVTQPSGSAFLSPVLLMQQRQTIAGFNVPYDSFAVPAAHRLVRAVMFSEQEASVMHGLSGGSGPAVLFAVDDESDRPLPHAIDAARSGATVGLAGLELRGTVFSYPAVEIVAIPSPPAIVAGTLLLLSALGVTVFARTAPTRN